MISDQEWDKLTPRERDAKVAEVLELPFILASVANGPRAYCSGGTLAECNARAVKINALYTMGAWKYRPESRDRLTTTWAGAGMVIDAMREKGWSLNLVYTNVAAQMIWSNIDAQGRSVQGAAKNTCPKQAIALAAVRAMGAKWH